MNVLYIFGNGLDLGMDMATAYSDFYKYLKGQKPKDKYLRKMFRSIKRDSLWADMELGLGIFTKKFKSSSEDYIRFHRYIIENLTKYLKQVEHRFHPEKELKERFVNDLRTPFRYIKPLYKNYSDDFDDIMENQEITFNLITLNYTDTLEKLCDDEPQLKRNIFHLHGKLGKPIVVGVDNETQIANKRFKEDQDVKNYIKKVDALKINQDDRKEYCMELIKQAKWIILYGVSMGETDKRLWEAIKERLSSKENLNIVRYIHDFNERLSKTLNDSNKVTLFCQQEEDKIKRSESNEFANCLGITEADNINLEGRFYTLPGSGPFGSKAPKVAKSDNKNRCIFARLCEKRS